MSTPEVRSKVASHVGSKAFAPGDTDWHDISSESFTSSATGEALPSGLIFAGVFADTEGNSSNSFVCARPSGSSAGALKIPANASREIPLRGINSAPGDGGVKAISANMENGAESMRLEAFFDSP
ncbi:MAG: hypothetical protein KKH12_16170 [Gammaproteobacteria bacterium]|nr:hypothetical protein [Gammaproteobacteria bacterium]